MITLERGTASPSTCDCGAATTRISSPFAVVGLTTYSHAFPCTNCARVEFAPVDPRMSGITVTSRRAAMPCSNCRGPVRKLPNPYYGVKRAMAPNIHFCTECDQA
jgi:hypothetical protein